MIGLSLASVNKEEGAAGFPAACPAVVTVYNSLSGCEPIPTHFPKCA